MATVRLLRKKFFVDLSGALFLFGCAALPFFNDFPYLKGIAPALSDLSYVGFALAGMVYSLFYLSGRMKIDVIWTGMSSLIAVSALTSLAVAYFKFGEFCGINICSNERMLRSFFSFFFKLILVICLIQCVKSVGLVKIRRAVIVGFYLNASYVFIEIMDRIVPFFLKIDSFGIVDQLDKFFHDRPNDWGPNRTRGLAFEPSYQALYLIIVLPFLVNVRGVFRRFHLAAWLICLFSAQSLTAYIASAVFLFLYPDLGGKFFFRIFKTLFLFVAAGLLLTIILSGTFNFLFGISASSRFGSMSSAINGIKENLLFGVGPGMSGYWITKYYDDLFFSSSEAVSWLKLGIENFDAPTFASLLTLVFDFGVVPILIFLIFSTIRDRWNRVFRSKIAVASYSAILVASFGISGYGPALYLFALTMFLGCDEL